MSSVWAVLGPTTHFSLLTTHYSLSSPLLGTKIAESLSMHVNLTAEYYHKLTYGIIQSVSLPPNTGIQEPADLNVAEVSNSGIELQVGYNTKIGDIDVNVGGNITTVKNRVVKLDGGTPVGDEFRRIEEGYSLGYLWGYKVDGIFQSQADVDAWRAGHENTR